MELPTQKHLISVFSPILSSRGKHYRKSARCFARAAIPGEEVVTHVDKDGAAETKQTAKEGDMVIHSVLGEEYVNTAAGFAKNYEPLEQSSIGSDLAAKLAALQDTYFPQFRAFDWFELHSWSRGIAPNGDGKDQEKNGAWQVFQAKGEIVGIFVSVDEKAAHFPDGLFMASWGEQMRMEAGDVLAAKTGPDGNFCEVYRITKTAFDNSYVEMA
eukprot:TRINITY_DN23710_c0_g1_i2.p1 TRINITY_DN23710_c0_g1~~TRINITY_DN23710_c0_g1_i2.p1  ORF type:complete len:214 (-),score=38.89 TRINITY_DN23710_c0_g1_i2:135-776(-)